MSALSSSRTSARPRSAVLLGLAGVAAALLASTLVGTVAAALGADPDFAPLRPYVYLTFAAVGTIASLIGWVVIARRARSSRRLLTVLVPVLTVLSLVPDVALLALGFIPGSGPLEVVALMLMHPIAAASAVIAGSRIQPAR